MNLLATAVHFVNDHSGYAPCDCREYAKRVADEYAAWLKVAKQPGSRLLDAR